MDSTKMEKQNAAKKMPAMSMVRMSMRVQPNVLRNELSRLVCGASFISTNLLSSSVLAMVSCEASLSLISVEFRLRS